MSLILKGAVARGHSLTHFSGAEAYPTPGSCAAELRLIDNTLVIIERAFSPVLASLTGRRHPAHDCVYSGPNIDVGAVRHQRDLIADRELEFGQ
jgi:hypothetical protein